MESFEYFSSSRTIYDADKFVWVIIDTKSTIFSYGIVHFQKFSEMWQDGYKQFVSLN